MTQNKYLHLLVDHLERVFGPDHKVVNYIGAVLPQAVSVMDVYSISDLRKEDVINQINPTSTFYIPPLHDAPAGDNISKLLGRDAQATFVRVASKWVEPKLSRSNAYGSAELDAIAQIDTYVVPETHKVAHASPALKSFLFDLALKPQLLEEYKGNPDAVVERADGLSAIEKYGLTLNKPGAIYALMRSTPHDIAAGRVLSEAELAKAEMTTDPIIIIVAVVVVI